MARSANQKNLSGGRTAGQPPHLVAAQQQARRTRRVTALSVSVLTVGLFIISAPAMIVLLVGMVPTMVAFFIDRDARKSAALTVAATNVSGVAPFLVDILAGAPTLASAFAMVTNVFALAVMYGAAGAGWVLVMFLQPVMAIYLRVSTEANIAKLRKAQDKLTEEWTDAVAR